MKCLKKIAMGTVLVAGSTFAHAELRSLDETSMSKVTGQAGITLELETKIQVGQISYRDEGALNINNLTLSGADGGALDNISITMDLAGDGEVLEHGFSEIERRFGKQFNSGDMVIHIGPTNSGDPTKLNDYLSAIDFGIEIGSVEARGATDSANLFSDISLKGYLGPTDIVVRNNGAATRVLANGDQASNSELQFDMHFAISDGSLNWEASDLLLLFNFAAVRIEGLQVHNRRGDDTLGHFGMASVTANISTGDSARTGKTNLLSVHELEFRADIDMPVFKVGGDSIGSVSFTDFAITDTSMLIYGHD